jgi:hypothetical protein
VLAKFLASAPTDWRCVFDLGSHPHTELQNPLKLLSAIVPSVIVANGMSRKIVVHGVFAACAVRQDMISLPIGAVDGSATDVTTTSCFAQHLSALCLCELRSSTA